ncbi:MAG: PQQ-like beta-propeller repeat protein [Gammaproteobacteria bacterium]|nr:PQQ-like beta-propeller repeat protein [Gammaproteobacteria bacterium]
MHKNIIYIFLLLAQCLTFADAYSPPGLQKKWEYLNGYTFFKPIFGKDGTVYTNSPETDSSEPALYAFTPQGKLKWALTFPTPKLYEYSRPIIGHDDTVYILGLQTLESLAILRAISPQGKLAWEKKLEGIKPYDQVYLSMRPDHTLLLMKMRYVEPRRPESTLIALDTNGNNKWQFTLPAETFYVIGKNSEVYMVCYNTGLIYHLSTNGQVKWISSPIPDIKSAAIADDGTFYVLTAHEIYALDQQGHTLWKNNSIDKYADHSLKYLSTINNGRMYVTSYTSLNGNISAVDTSGKEIWRKTFYQHKLGRITFDKDIIYITIKNQWDQVYLAGYDFNGNQVCQSTPAHFVLSGVTIDREGTIYTGGSEETRGGLRAYLPCSVSN